MKISILTLVSILLCAMPLLANTNSAIAPLSVPKNEKAVVLNIEGRSLEYISFEDEYGIVLMEDAIEKSKYRIKYDLQSLPSGIYTIKLYGENFVEFYQTTISNQAVKISKTDSYYRPRVSNTNERLQVDIQKSTGGDLYVTIIDESDEEVYTFQEKIDGTYQKVFNLKELGKGAYKVLISNEYFTEQVLLSLK